LRKGSGHAIEIATKLENNANPAIGAAPPKEALATRVRVWLSMQWMFDRQHDVQQRIRDLRVPPTNMVPGFESEFNRSAIRPFYQQVHDGRR